MPPYLSRQALARVLTSLLKSEIKAARLHADACSDSLLAADTWPENLQMTGEAPDGLRCDSLDVLRLAAAANEMFHLHAVSQERDLLAAGTFGEWLDSIEAAWTGGVARITFMTSGSTGRPKRCTHEFSHLQAEITYLAEIFADRTRIVALTPAHHIYGFLFTAMLPDRLGHQQPVTRTESASRLPLDLGRGDLVVGFPERWQWLHRTVAQWPEGVSGVVSTAPCPPDLKAGLMERGLSSFTEVYGSSETAGLGVRRWPETRYRFMPQWKYCNASSAEGTLVTHDSGLEIRVQDHLELEEDGSFTLAGRIDAAVQVGGTNVYPKRIAALLRNQPGVLDAAVRLDITDRGSRLKAFVVPQPHIEPAALRSQLQQWANSTLKPAERPKSITFGSDLPKDQKGKDCDWTPSSPPDPLARAVTETDEAAAAAPE